MNKAKDYIKKMYGMDALSCACILVSMLMDLVILILAKTGHPGGLKWSIVSWVPLLVCVLRALSTNRERRTVENDWFVSKLDPLLLKKPKDDYGQKYLNEVYGPGTYHEEDPEEYGRKPPEKQHAQERKHFKFFKCPACHQKIRVPKGKGRIEITCPRCGEKFVKKT